MIQTVSTDPIRAATELTRTTAGAALTAEELADLIQASQAATERLQAAHADLERTVRRLREELAEKNAELARKNRLAALGQMAAGVAHEVRNPLGAIRLFAGILRRDLNESARSEHTSRLAGYAEKILAAVAAMDRIVEEMLSLARTREPRLVPRPLAPIIAQALEAAAQELAERQVQVVRCGGKTSDLVCADRDQLARAFLNIVLNAAQAMEGGGQLTIAVEDHDGPPPAIRVRFTDTGPGIAPEHLERVFEPFFTGREGGTGLGLALVNRIVESHRGRVWARNEPVGGATFIIELPAAQDGQDGMVQSVGEKGVGDHSHQGCCPLFPSEAVNERCV